VVRVERKYNFETWVGGPHGKRSSERIRPVLMQVQSLWDLHPGENLWVVMSMAKESVSNERRNNEKYKSMCCPLKRVDDLYYVEDDCTYNVLSLLCPNIDQVEALSPLLNKIEEVWLKRRDLRFWQFMEWLVPEINRHLNQHQIEKNIEDVPEETLISIINYI